jgi:hypothetical protein
MPRISYSFAPGFGESGTRIDAVAKTFYDIIGAGNEREYEGVAVGPIHPQTFSFDAGSIAEPQ